MKRMYTLRRVFSDSVRDKADAAKRALKEALAAVV